MNTKVISAHDRKTQKPRENLRSAAKTLASDLRGVISGEVRFDDGSRALYSTDASNYRQIPIGVVIPKTVEDVVQTVKTCRQHGAPILSRGGGTSLAGQCCNVAVVIDFSKYLNRVLDIDPTKKKGRVEPGCVLDHLRTGAEKYHLTFGPDPATHNHNTLGGMIGNDSCGIHSVLAVSQGYGARTADHIEELEILTYNGTRMRVGKTPEGELEQIIRRGGRKGEIYSKLRDFRNKYSDLIRAKFPKIPRRVSGFNLPYLLPENGFHVARALVGSESTCVVVLEAVANLIYSPPARSLLVLGYPDVFAAGDHVPEIMKHQPSGLEGLDDVLIDYMKKKNLHAQDLKFLPEGKGWLLVELWGENKQESDDKARQLMEELKRNGNPPQMKLYDNPEEEKHVWEVRESGLGATANVPGEPYTWPGWEDSAVPPDQVGNYLRQLKKLFQKYNYRVSLYGHFGQGCIHCRIPFDLVTAKGISAFRSFLDEASDLVVSFGGSLSGEHGDGQSRAELLPKMFGSEITDAFREFKAIWDPESKMNPGKVVDPYKITENLRLGTDYNPPEPKTHFQFPEDHGSFAEATLRCVGVGECRRDHRGTMCPSYRVTREEEHSTRGRARLLFEMMQGDAIHNGWKSEAVKEALDLCLACKGCKGDCPVNVDMATYKAEFLSHYYSGRLRPRHAYAFGFIHPWATLASRMPGLVNFFTQTPGLRTIAKFAAGMSLKRNIPQFAPKTFVQTFRNHRVQRLTDRSKRVMLWPDTFNNYFLPQTAQAAVDVLEKCGFHVEIPEQNLCCGRPLYDYGFLDTAKDWLTQILQSLREPIRAGIPLIVLEPSCAAVFLDELRNLFPHDEDAMRLSQQTMLLSDFLAKQGENISIPKLKANAIVHGHCHHKAVIGLSDEQEILKRLGLDFEVLDSGCCGMAGSFGFESGEHYDVSIKCGERVLLPAVREASKETLIIADGFSCREQISQTTDRHALHIAEVLQMAIRKKTQEISPQYPERRFIRQRNYDRIAIPAALALATIAGAGIWYWKARKK